MSNITVKKESDATGMLREILSATGFTKMITLASQLAIVNRHRVLSKPLKRIRAFAYAGNQYECPFCNRGYSKLLPYGNPKSRFQRQDVVPAVYRENVLCPRCESLERERLIKLYIERKTGILKKQTRLLHVAPEGNLAAFLSPQPLVDYVSMDISDEAMLRADLCRLGLKDSAFDAIICSHVLEHVTDDIKAMAELNRVLRKGGWAIIQVPISYSVEKTVDGKDTDLPEMREVLFGQENHVRLYGRDFFNRLERAGFSTQDLPPSAIVGEDMVARYALNPREHLIVCSKN